MEWCVSMQQTLSSVLSHVVIDRKVEEEEYVSGDEVSGGGTHSL